MTDYVTTAEVKAIAQHALASDDDTYDTIIASLITRASRLVDRLTRREDNAYDAPATGTVRYFDGEGGLYQAIDECISVSAVSIRQTSGTTTWTDLESTDYREWPYNYSDQSVPIMRLDMDRRQGSYSTWPTGRQAVKVTAKWGYSDDPPPIIEQAVIAQVIRWFKRGQQMYTDSSMMAAAGELTYAKKLDPGIETILKDSGIMKKQDLF